MLKKIFSTTTIIAVLILSASSCGKCTNCTKSGGSAVRLCEKDYDSNTAYGIAVDFYEGTGYDCK
jgi:hypothetical protein